MPKVPQTPTKPSTTIQCLPPTAMALLSKAPTPNVAISTTGMPLQPELALTTLASMAPMSQALFVPLAGDYQVLQVMALPLQVMALAIVDFPCDVLDLTRFFKFRAPLPNFQLKRCTVIL